MGANSIRREGPDGIPRVRTRQVAIAVALACLVLGGCLRPTGDFDRAAPSVIHDDLLPAAGEQVARVRGDPVSKFNYTNDERTLRDRSWALIRPPWTKDWIGGTVVELSRTRILPETEGKVPPDLYYIYLKSDRFQSSDARFDMIASDAKGDADLVPPYCEIARRVMNADNERLRALNAKRITTEELYEGAKARVFENRARIKWSAQALRYRITAYKRALDSLEIETPSRNRLWQVNTAIAELEKKVRILETGCQETGARTAEAPVRRSRIYTGWGTERAPQQK